MTSIRIRRATLEDLPLLVANNRAMALETEGKSLDADTVTRGTRAALDDERRGFYLVATSDDRAVGQLMVTYEWSDWRAGDFWWIQSVYVDPSARRRGVYRALYAHLLARARAEPGVVGVRLYVEHENHAAQATYAALGMKRASYAMYEVDFVLGSSDVRPPSP